MGVVLFSLCLSSENSAACQYKDPQPRIATSFHKRGQFFIRTHNETLSPRAHRNQTVRPLESIAEIRPNSNRLC
jgi:hypothetical protein